MSQCASARIVLYNIFTTHRLAEGISLAEIIKFCKTTKILPVFYN